MWQSGKKAVGITYLAVFLSIGMIAPMAWAADEQAVAPLSLAAAAQAQPTDAAKADASQSVPSSAPAEGAVTAPVAASQPAAAAASQPADPIQAFIAKVKNPVPFFKWGADYRIRNEYVRNVNGLNKSIAENDRDWLRHRPRIWSTLSLENAIEFNSRIVWEGRNWFEPESAQNFDLGEIMFDVLNVTVRKPGGLPFTVVAGRQEIALGDKWLVFEGTPYDGSRTLFFDAIRITTELEKIKTKIDTIYLETDSEGEHWVNMIKHRDRDQMTGAHTQRYLVEQDEQGAILWVENKSLKNTEIDGYFIYKRDMKGPYRFSDNADIYTFGERIVHNFDEHWKARSEITPQFGRRDGNSICALGSLNRLAYYFNDKHNNWLRLDYEYLSGDKPGTKGTDESFDLLWGRWPRFSELLIYLTPVERRPCDFTNLHRVAMGWSTNITPKTEMLTDYHLLFAAQNSYRTQPAYTDSGCFKGQLFTWWLKHTFTPQLSGHVVAEFFIPGDYYDKANNDPAAFVRTELMFTF
jgi:hypothetical protein